MVKPYKELFDSFRVYWELYGGWRALIVSPYLHLAALITFVCIWFGPQTETIWSTAAVNILPNLLGFTVAGMAVFLAFSHPETMEAITEEGEPRSYFVTTMAAFFHFIFVQSVALLLGVVGRYFSNIILAVVGTLVLVYAILVGLAMGMQLLHTSRIINAAFSLPKKTEVQQDDHVNG